MTKEQWDISHKYEISVRNMNSSGWAKMSESEKIENLQSIEDWSAMKAGRLPAEVIAQELPEGYMGYQQDNTIVISQSLLDSPDFPEALDTLFHEGSHIQDWQAEFLSEVRENYTADELEARASPVPDSDKDWDGYWNHPAEREARTAGTAGVNQTMDNREQILEADKEFHFHGNQILETYDYLVLEDSSQGNQELSTTGIEENEQTSASAETESADTDAEAEALTEADI
ncbi:MAG: hypothetical protein Q4F28_10885 [Eubacteriales bacterium]|nr:hypothetical protein [Eubacteriales bacterium]